MYVTQISMAYGDGWKADRMHRWVPAFDTKHLYTSTHYWEVSNIFSMSYSNSFDHPPMLCVECGVAKED